jgi:hypothetical protein
MPVVREEIVVPVKEVVEAILVKVPLPVPPSE